MKRRVFTRWSIVLTLVWLIANLPRRSGLAGIFNDAGFPLVFAWGFGNRLENFDTVRFATDLFLGIADRWPFVAMRLVASATL